MKFYKVSKLYLNCLPIDKEVIAKLKDKDCYIGYDLVGDIAIYQKENNEFVCSERIRPSTELNNIFTFLEHAQVTTL